MELLRRARKWILSDEVGGGGSGTGLGGVSGFLCSLRPSSGGGQQCRGLPGAVLGAVRRGGSRRRARWRAAIGAAGARGQHRSRRLLHAALRGGRRRPARRAIAIAQQPQRGPAAVRAAGLLRDSAVRPRRRLRAPLSPSPLRSPLRSPSPSPSPSSRSRPSPAAVQPPPPPPPSPRVRLRGTCRAKPPRRTPCWVPCCAARIAGG